MMVSLMVVVVGIELAHAERNNVERIRMRSVGRIFDPPRFVVQNVPIELYEPFQRLVCSAHAYP